MMPLNKQKLNAQILLSWAKYCEFEVERSRISSCGRWQARCGYCWKGQWPLWSVTSGAHCERKSATSTSETQSDAPEHRTRIVLKCKHLIASAYSKITIKYKVPVKNKVLVLYVFVFSYSCTTYVSVCTVQVYACCICVIFQIEYSRFVR